MMDGRTNSTRYLLLVIALPAILLAPAVSSGGQNRASKLWGSGDSRTVMNGRVVVALVAWNDDYWIFHSVGARVTIQEPAKCIRGYTLQGLPFEYCWSTVR